MTPTDPIRPGAALNDPDLRAGLQARLEVLAAAGPRAGAALQIARDTWSVLAAYPWQRFNYRYGRWQADVILWRALITFEAWESYRWRRDTGSFQLLNPHSGERVGEFYSREYLRSKAMPPGDEPDVVAEPGGTLEFAGDPGSVGVYRTPGGDASTLRFSWTPRLILGSLRGGIEMLRAGAADRLPPAQPPLDLDVLDGARVWFTHSPDKPPGKPDWKAAYRAHHYRPGGRQARFGRTKP
ncbi:hypothetical protein [Mangrovihabitans endophyticus]|uniref:hypothetical protein n=1 Tax=Mangrovihabitans endophyticus TaxID=1751298 RepID=UPI00166B28B2|nr:hypothetical protein [Mangrovihabitans endophyticus]